MSIEIADIPKDLQGERCGGCHERPAECGVIMPFVDVYLCAHCARGLLEELATYLGETDDDQRPR